MEHDINLIGYIDGDLPETEIKDIREHLKTCTDCREKFEDLKKSIQLFSTVFEKQPGSFKNLHPGMDDHLDISCDHPLPESIKMMLSQKKTTDLRERLSRALARMPLLNLWMSLNPLHRA